MATTDVSLYEKLYHYVENPVVPEIKDYLMTGNPQKLIVLLACYLFFCLRLGPWYMKDRKPYQLKTVINVYNVFQIFISLYLFYEGTIYLFFTDFNFCCQGLDDVKSPSSARIAKAVWLYYFVKLIDLMDTVFFVLRKSNRQITALHVHHHTIMPIITWVGVTFVPGGQGVIIGYINSLVHAVMYTYYLLAGLGDEYKKYLWWKKYLTMMQLVQFAIVLIHSVNSLFYSCSYPVIFKLFTIFYAILFLNMFGNFYYNSYIKAKNDKNIRNVSSGINKAANNKTH
ncbi:elongation of very long chain fatty acids protein 7-like [Vanessa cardui]|uniref:elongation of very long chain fatty acids protein 7-like n=1 Tax=Vanessa cardui TaxID=171605 RepID=UPI001F1477C9|nr:elongation of very long chain fatty acids protein 7-like [Vanessa cardui]